MDPSNIINLALLLVTAVGVLVAILAAVDARKSKSDASTYEQRALQASRDAASAAERSAAALERQAAAAEAGLQKEPWLVTPTSNKHRWKITNNTGNAASLVRVTGKPPGHLTVEGQFEGGFFDVPKGESVFISFGGGFTDPSYLDISIDWKDVRGSGDKVSFTLP